MDLQKQIESLFDGRAFDPSLFESYPNKRRFELSTGGATVEQLLFSLQKAHCILTDIFADGSPLVVCLRTRSEDSLFSHRTLISELYNAGINISGTHCLWMSPVANDERYDPSVEEWWFNLAFEVPLSSLRALLWCTHASDFGSIRLRPTCTVYLFNISRQVLVLPFDDRTMDVVGVDQSLLSGLSSKHSENLTKHKSYDPTIGILPDIEF